MSDKQKTIKSEFSISGAGLHTGIEATLTFKPAPVNFGIKFKRVDISGSPIVNADVDYVVNTNRGTNLEQNGISILSVEHPLAALAGLGIDNVLIEMNCAETPILDGSSRPYVDSLLKAKIIEQEEYKDYIEIDTVVRYADEKNKVEILAVPSMNFQMSVMIDYDSNVLGSQNANLYKLEDFKDDFSSARTFVFLHELQELLDKQLIKGGDLSNAIVFVNKTMSKTELDRLAMIFNKPKVEVLKEGILNNVNLKFPNEPARHKLLDLLGDISLVGRPLKAHIIANRPGHFSNIQFAKLIKQHIKSNRNNHKIPYFDLNKKPLYDINDIKRILPHRYPMLLVDKILEMSDTHVVGIKNVTMNESFFIGHFPDQPLMPGVMLIEAMAQTGGIFAFNTVPDPENYIPFFLKVDKARFRQNVVPGDTVVFKLDLISPIRRGITHMKGYAYVGNRIVMEAELMAQIMKK
jgi:UDP-3-O-[3-hydroxymyristoyl] N-acetylglucosamine deacetylase / 3-hydroxyacyl-[acyl-carrier-protein] dehydratase